MRLKALALMAKIFGIRFKVDGIPYGARFAPTEPVDCS